MRKIKLHISVYQDEYQRVFDRLEINQAAVQKLIHGLYEKQAGTIMGEQLQAINYHLIKSIADLEKLRELQSR